MLASTAQLVKPLYWHKNAAVPITLYLFGIVIHEQDIEHDNMLAMEILMLRLCINTEI